MEIHEDNKMVTETIDTLAASVVKYMTAQGLTLSLAESCTGGLIAAAITSVSGASQIFLGSAVTYTEDVKTKLLGVSSQTLAKYTVYSEQTALEMSKGANELFGSDYSVAVTGIAGPSGGTPEKPVGTVYISVASREKQTVRRFDLCGDRNYENYEYDKLDRRSIRMLTVMHSLEMLADVLEEQKG